jgi:Mg/Co/Ni transporter MgtE
VLLRQAPPQHVAALVAGMEPDEAIEALRKLAEDDRSEIRDAMPATQAERLSELLDYPEGTAGGLMTTVLVTVSAADTRQ